MDQLTLPQRVDRAAIEAVLPAWREAIASAGAVTVDASRVERIGQCGWQLLIAAGNSARGVGKPFRLVASPALESSAEVAGLAAWLESVSDDQ